MGWWRFLVVAVIFGFVSQPLVVGVLSIIAFESSEFSPGRAQSWAHVSREQQWVQKRPPEALVLPLSLGGRVRIGVGTRVEGARYHPSFHEDVADASDGLGFISLVQDYEPRSGWVVHQYIEDRIGFPLPAARSVFFMETPVDEINFRSMEWNTHRGVGLAADYQGGLGFPREFVAIPLSLIWSGLVMNALFFAGLTAAMMLAVRSVRLLRARSRHRRGACVCCVYRVNDLSSCPECGMNQGSRWSAAILAGCKLKHLCKITS